MTTTSSRKETLCWSCT